MTSYFAIVRESFIKIGIARISPSVMRVLDYYEHYFSTHALISRGARYDKCGQFFQAIVNWNDSSLFSLEWDITGIINALKNTQFPIIKISRSFNLFCDESKVEKSRVQEIINTPNTQREPILLVWIEFINTYYVIDGNHRYTAFCHSEQETIDAIILPAVFHLKYMLSEESRMRYMIFHNIAVLHNMFLQSESTVSEEWDDRHSLYSISGEKICFSRFQHTLLFFYSLLLRLRSRIAGGKKREA